MPDVADHCLMRVNIAKSASQPAAVRVLVTDPTMQFGIVESLGEAAREALAPGRDEVGRLAMHHCTRRAAPLVLVLHVYEDAR